MGHNRHNSIIVTSWRADSLAAAHQRAKDLFPNVSEIVRSAVNIADSFFIAPDGADEDSDCSKIGDANREKFIAWMEATRAPESLHGPLDWVEIQYGDDNLESVLVRDSDAVRRLARAGQWKQMAERQMIVDGPSTLTSENMLELLRIASEHDVASDLFWHSDLRFFVNCNDLFAWGGSDLEPLFTEADLRLFETCCQEAKNDGPALYCASRRKMRPQGACYEKWFDRKNWPLFDACGPLRPASPGNPGAHFAPGEEPPPESSATPTTNEEINP